MWVQQGFEYNFFLSTVLWSKQILVQHFFVKIVLVNKIGTKKYWFKIFGQKNLGSKNDPFDLVQYNVTLPGSV